MYMQPQRVFEVGCTHTYLEALSTIGKALGLPQIGSHQRIAVCNGRYMIHARYPQPAAAPADKGKGPLQAAVKLEDVDGQLRGTHPAQPLVNGLGGHAIQRDKGKRRVTCLLQVCNAGLGSVLGVDDDAVHVASHEQRDGQAEAILCHLGQVDHTAPHT